MLSGGTPLFSFISYWISCWFSARLFWWCLPPPRPWSSPPPLLVLHSSPKLPVEKNLCWCTCNCKKTRLGPVGDLCKCSEVCQPAISRWRPSENHLPRTCWSGDGIGDKASKRERKKRPVWRSSASMTTLPFFAGGGGTIAAVPLDPREPPFTCLLELAIWIFSHMHMCE